MALVSRKAPAPKPAQPDPIVVEVDGVHSPVVETDVTNVTTLLQHIGGSSWTVNYYQQILGPEQSPSAFDASAPNSLQQYRKINNLELKVQSPLSHQEDRQTNSLTVVGDAYVYPVLIPNVGDVFEADTGEGMVGVLSVTSVERLSHFKDAVYTISYRVIYRNEPRITRLLDNRVVKEVFFRKDYLENGSDPFLVKEEKERVDNLNDLFTKLTAYYRSRFYSAEYKTLLMPDERFRVYDPMVVKAFTMLFDTHELPILRELRQLNIHGIPQYRQRNIWDAILYRDPNILFEIGTDADCVRVHQFRDQPEFGGIAYTGMDYLIVPKQAFTSESHVGNQPQTFSSYVHKPVKRHTVLERCYPHASEAPENPDNDGLTLTPMIGQLDGYLLPKGFYELYTKPGSDYVLRSDLEVLLKEHLDLKTVNLESLLRLGNNAFNWEHGEAFYYIPVVLILIKSCLVAGRRS